MRFSRRFFLLASGAALLAGTAQAQSFNTAELLKAGPLGDKIQGDAKAPVTIIEYASLTCPHCEHFHATVYPMLKKNYIDTGKVRFIFREFPRDPVDIGAFMLARCAPPDRYFAMIDVLFDQQKNWAFTKDAAKQLLMIAKQAGFTEESFDKCLSDKKLAEEIRNVGKHAYEKFKVDSTPTLFINGQVYRGEMTPEGMEKALAPLLKG
ncbi:MAG TPA: DsbA family protein [Xanthobacteraceae bacterium]|nr:DsbA family protein [Xanthobacteraceae bacterium]